MIAVYFPCTITWNAWRMKTSHLLEKILTISGGRKSYSDLKLLERENKALREEDLNWTLKDVVS